MPELELAEPIVLPSWQDQLTQTLHTKAKARNGGEPDMAEQIAHAMVAQAVDADVARKEAAKEKAAKEKVRQPATGKKKVR